MLLNLKYIKVMSGVLLDVVFVLELVVWLVGGVGGLLVGSCLVIVGVLVLVFFEVLVGVEFFELVFSCGVFICVCWFVFVDFKFWSNFVVII